MEIQTEPQFSAEAYRGKTIDFVHKGSIDRVLQRKKPADQSTVNKARMVLQRLGELEVAGIPVRHIGDPSRFIPPEDSREVTVGGAFVGQCLSDYIQAAKEYTLAVDPLLSVELD